MTSNKEPKDESEFAKTLFHVKKSDVKRWVLLTNPVHANKNQKVKVYIKSILKSYPAREAVNPV